MPRTMSAKVEELSSRGGYAQPSLTLEVERGEKWREGEVVALRYRVLARALEASTDSARWAVVPELAYAEGARCRVRIALELVDDSPQVVKAGLALLREVARQVLLALDNQERV